MGKKKRADPEYGDDIEIEEPEPEEQTAPQPEEECTHTLSDKKNGFCKHT